MRPIKYVFKVRVLKVACLFAVWCVGRGVRPCVRARVCVCVCACVRACVRACVCVLFDFSFSCLQGEGFRQTAGKYHAILRYKLLRRREFRSVHDLSGQNHDFSFYSLSTGRLEEGERFPSGMIYQSEICIHPAFHQRNYSRTF